MLLTVHVQPNAKQKRIEWLDEDTMKVWLTAPAKEGKANVALVEFLSDHFDVPKSKIRIVRGLTTKMKHVEIE